MGDTFDPSSAPRFPVLTLEILEGADGPEVWFDGTRVPVDGDGPLDSGDPRLYAAGIRSAAERAGERSGLAKSVRVLALSPGAESEELVVEADGTVHSAGDRHQAGSKAAKWRALTRPQKVVLVGACAAAAVSVGALLGLVTSTNTVAAGGAPKSVQATPSGPVPTLLPVLGPTGQVETALWASPPVAGERVSVVVAAGRLVTISAEGDLVGLSLESGQVVWRHELKGGSSSTRLTVSRSGDGPDQVVAITGSVVEVVDASTGRVVHHRELQSEDDPSVVPGGVIIRSGGVGALIRDASGVWVPRVVPPGAAPIAQVGDSLVSMNARGQVWSVTDPAVPPPPAQLPPPAKGAVARGVLASTREGLLFGWNVADGSVQLVQQYVWSDLAKPVRTFPAGRPGEGAPRGSSVAASQDGSWLILDQDLVDLTSGRVTRLPQDWRTDVVLEGRAYAKPSPDGLRSVTRSGKVSTVSVRGTARIATPAAQGGSVAAVVSAGDGVSARVYGLDVTGPSGPSPRGKR